MMHEPCKEIVDSFIRQRTRKHCEDTGHVCPHWANFKIVEDLDSLDKKDGGSRVKEYMERCHRVDVVMSPGPEPEDWKFKIHCTPHAIWKPETCAYHNDEAENTMLKEFIEYSKEEGQNAPM